MKRWFLILLTAIMLLSFNGCANTDNNQNESSQKSSVVINVPQDENSTDFENESNSTIHSSEIYTEQPVIVDQNGYSYCGNKNSKKFHIITCGSLKTTKEENKVFFATREDYINKGYVPCKRCNP